MSFTSIENSERKNRFRLQNFISAAFYIFFFFFVAHSLFVLTFLCIYGKWKCAYTFDDILGSFVTELNDDSENDPPAQSMFMSDFPILNVLALASYTTHK